MGHYIFNVKTFSFPNSLLTCNVVLQITSMTDGHVTEFSRPNIVCGPFWTKWLFAKCATNLSCHTRNLDPSFVRCWHLFILHVSPMPISHAPHPSTSTTTPWAVRVSTLTSWFVQRTSARTIWPKCPSQRPNIRGCYVQERNASHLDGGTCSNTHTSISPTFPTATSISLQLTFGPLFPEQCFVRFLFVYYTINLYISLTIWLYLSSHHSLHHVYIFITL